MDFDDLDEEISKRVQEGEAVAGNFVENRQPVKGTVLPKMRRTHQLPDFSRLPDRVKKTLAPYNGKAVSERSPVLRLLCIHGAADAYSVDWCNLEEEAPPEVEVATHEFPGHGHRDAEPFCVTLDELCDDCFDAFRDAMDTGAFALLGHSIGALVAIKIAKRARAELGVEPVAVIMLERGAAQHPLFTEVGAERLRSDPASFFEYWNPMVFKLYKSAGDIGKRTLDMWQKDQLMDQDAIEVGHHTFKCPLTAFAADGSWDSWVTLKDLDEKEAALTQQNIEAGAYRIEKDGKAFAGHFPAWTYDGWKDWTEHPKGCNIVKCKDCATFTSSRRDQKESPMSWINMQRKGMRGHVLQDGHVKQSHMVLLTGYGSRNLPGQERFKKQSRVAMPAAV
ncbi:grsT [Symbiodinium microadriaticum]|nr:grsT [Symbiodinium microadriaticum]